MCPKEDIIETVEHNRKDVFYYLHMMPQEASMGPGRANLLQNHLINAGFSDEDANSILGMNAANIYNDEVSEGQLNQIYNAANLNVSSTLGEGCGLSLLESAATGTPSIAPRNSAIPEVLNGTGELIQNTALMNQALDNGHLSLRRYKFDLAAPQRLHRYKYLLHSCLKSNSRLHLKTLHLSNGFAVSWLYQVP